MRATITLTNLISGGFETNVNGWAAAAGSANPARLTPIPSPSHGEIGNACLQHNGTVNSNAQGGANRICTQYQSISVVSGRVYYMRAQVRVSAGCTGFQFNNNGVDIGHSLADTPLNTWVFIDYLWTSSSSSFQLRLQSASTENGNAARTFQIDNVMLIDVTTPFGAGTEPPIGVMRGIVSDEGGYWDGSISIDIPEPPEILITTPTIGLYERNYNWKVDVVEGTGTEPFFFTISGLPNGNGLSINNLGEISGFINIQEGVYPFSVSVTDSFGYRDTESFLLYVYEPPKIHNDHIPGAISDSPYLFEPNVSGSTPVLTLINVISGSLPIGLSILTDSVTGNQYISGTPTVSNQSCQIRITSSNSYDTVTHDYLFSVVSTVVIDTLSPIRSGILNQVYSPLTFLASGAPPITWEHPSGDLPNGMSFSSLGVLSGTPTQSGVFSFSIRASNIVNSVTYYDTKLFQLTINVLPVITTTTLPYSRIDTPYSTQLSATGTSPFTWSIVGSLPPGLSLNSQTGVISGSSLVQGIYNFNVICSNIAGSSAPVSLSIEVGFRLVISTTSPLPNGTVSVPYTPFQFQSVGINRAQAHNYSWAAQPGSSLPPGLTLNTTATPAESPTINANTGLFSGTPTTPGEYRFNVTVNNGAGVSSTSPFTITIGQIPTITTNVDLFGSIGRPYTTVLSATNNPTSWSMISGPTPSADINLQTNGALTWLIPVVGTYVFTIVATNAFGTSTPVTFSLTITTPSIIDVFPEDNTQVLNPEVIIVLGENYSHTFSANGVMPLQWQQLPPLTPPSSGVISGLPPGLLFNSSTATLQGIPITEGKYKFDLQVTNLGGSVRESFWITVVVKPLILTSSLNSGNVGVSYNQVITASGTTPINYSIVTPSGSETGLPPGLSFTGGVISGFPTTSGFYTFTIRVVNITGILFADEKQFSIRINLPQAPIITTSTNLSAIRGVFYSVTFQAQNTGSQFNPITWSLISGVLPNGLSITNDTITGTPIEVGVFQFTIRVTNSDGDDERLFILAVADPPIITTQSIPDGVKNESYSETMSATGDKPITWSILPLTGSETGLPDGLSLNSSTGEIYGTPTVDGVFSFRIRALNSSGTDTVAFSITIISNETIFFYYYNNKIDYLFTDGDEVYELYDNDVLKYKSKSIYKKS